MKKTKMSPLQLLLILHMLFSYVSLITTLPVTSKPLGNTPEHLTWEAWLMVDSKNPSEHEKSRKITPKSIFITPNFNNMSQINCPPNGYKVDKNGQCIQIVNINPEELLASQIQNLLSSSSDTNAEDIDYDYDNYDSAAQIGPFQVNIPLNINIDQDPSDSLKGDFDYDPLNLNNNNNTDDKDYIDEIYSKKTFLEERSTTTTLDNKVTTTTHKTNINVLPLSTEGPTDNLTTNFNQNSEMIETTTASITTTTNMINKIDSEQTTTMKTLFENEKKNTENDELTLIEMVGNDSIKESLKPGNDNLKLELQKESFLFDVNETTLTTTDENAESNSSSTVTELNEISTILNIDGETINTTVNIDETKITTEPSDYEAQPSTFYSKIVLSPNLVPQATTESIVVITPSNEKSKINPIDSEITNLKIENETNSDKRLRESLGKHEEKESAIENIDTRNRFVYHHLGNDSPKFHIPSVAQSQLPLSSSPPPISSTTFKSNIDQINDQMREINRIIEENRNYQHNSGSGSNRIRFPTSSFISNTNVNHNVRSDSDVVRFPGPTSQRNSFNTNVNNFNNEKEVKPSSTNPPIEQKQPPFWWLTNNYWDNASANTKNPHHSYFHRFWAQRTQTPARTSTSYIPPTHSTPHWRSRVTMSRGNSRSPTENLYRELTSHQDIYKVLGSRNSNHNNR